MDDQIDSLDHIRAISAGNQEPEVDRQRNPSLLFGNLPDDTSHSASFGAGGRISHVIDPEFRAPSSIATASPYYNNVMDRNVPLPPDSNVMIHVPYATNDGSTYTSSPLIANTNASIGFNTNTTTTSSFEGSRIDSRLTGGTDMPFSTQTSTASFSDLAKKSVDNNTISSSTNILTNTLHEYGPPSAPRPVVNQNVSERPVSSYPEYPHSTETSDPLIFGCDSRESAIPMPPPLPTYDVNQRYPSYDSNQMPFTPATSHLNSRGLGPYKNPVTSSRSNSASVVYSPPPRSPPLDHIEKPAINSHTSRPHHGSSRSINDHKKLEPLGDENYNEMDLLSLTQKHRILETRQRKIKEHRDAIERHLADMTRNSQGKNIEMDPAYWRKKDDQKECDARLKETKKAMEKIENLSRSKYSVPIAPSITTKQASQPQQRVKMSTSTPQQNRRTSRDRDRDHKSSKDERLYKFELKLSDAPTWCETCDEHFETVIGYCEHLHTREHIREMNKSTPWKKAAEKITHEKTNDLLKSIFAQLDNESGFSMFDFESIINPNIKDKKMLRERSKDRERRKFNDKDPLFQIKGYNFLVPVSGFYCQLCKCALCDQAAALQHLRGYEHIKTHAKLVAANPQIEVTYRSKKERSYKKQFGETRNESPKDIQKELHKEISRSPSKDKIKNNIKVTESRPVAPITSSYKKATSHIVDEHDVIKDKFPRKKVIDLPASIPSTSKNKTPPSPPKIRKKNSAPEIIRLDKSRSQPAALKRLRREYEKEPSPEPSPEPSTEQSPEPSISAEEIPEAAACLLPDLSSKPYISSSDTEDDDIMEIDETRLESGDPDSPFPGLELCITGNIHADSLKDKRLATACKVMMNRINLEDYKHMLLESTTLWSRVNHMVAKKEPSRIGKDLKEKTKTVPTYFSTTGDIIPVDVDTAAEQAKRNSEIANGRISVLEVGGTGANLDKAGSEERSESDKEFDMRALDSFFCG